MKLIFVGWSDPQKWKPTKNKIHENKTHGEQWTIYAQQYGKSAGAADDWENSQDVRCIAVEIEPGNVVSHQPRECVMCALRCIVTGWQNYWTNLSH